jgi:RNA polymerase sigma-70 factor, ECF subfamily
MALLLGAPRTIEPSESTSGTQPSCSRERLWSDGRAQVSDQWAIAEFLVRDYSRVVNAVAFAGFGFDQAEDAVQEAVVRAWMRAERGETIRRLDAWVTVTAWNLSRSGLRRLGAEHRARERLAAGLFDARSSPASDDAVDIARAMAVLPRRQREVAVLRYQLQLTTKETAAALDISEGTVKRALADAREVLRRLLEVQEQDQSEVRDDADR